MRRMAYAMEVLMYASFIVCTLTLAWLAYRSDQRMQREHEYFMTHTEETLRAHDAFLQEHQRRMESY